MTRRIVASSMKARGFVVGAAAVILALGAWNLRAMRVDSLPEFTPPTVEIQTEALGLAAPEVEQLITVPLEQDLLAGVPWLDTIRSESIPGLSSVELIFDPGTDLLRARQMVQERLTQAAGLPNVSGPPQMLQPLSSTSRIMLIRISSATFDQRQLSVEARWTIRPKLLGVQGVANVSIWGQRERQLQVQVDPERLRRRGLTLDEVIETTGNALWASPLTFLEASTPGTGGFIDTAQQRLGIQHLQPITTASDLAEVPVESANGRAYRLGDVARVVESHQPLIGDAVFTHGDPGLLLVVEKFPGANTLDVTDGVEDAIDTLRPGLSGIHIDTTVYRPATYIERGSRNLAVAFVVALALMVAALVALWFEWRAAAIGIAAILASLSVAWLVLYLARTTVDTMVLAGLAMALAVVVDDALVDVHAVAQRLHRQRMNGVRSSAWDVILEAVGEMRSSLVFATAIAIATVVPFFFASGEAAPFLPPIAWSFALAVGASLLVALTLTPALALLLLPGTPLELGGSPLMAWLRRGYDRALPPVTAAPRRAYLGLAVGALAGLVALPFVSASALPSFHDGNVLIDLSAMPGTSLPEMDRITDRIGRELEGLPGIADVSGHVGRAITSDRVVGVDAAQLWASLEPDADYDAALGSIRSVVDGYPGLAHAVRTYSDERIARVLADTGSPIDVRLYGIDLGVLHAQAARVADAIRGVDGIVRPRITLQPVEPTIGVRVDLQRAERYGIVPGDVRRAAATLLSGIGVGSLFEQQKVFDVVVWGTPDDRNSLDSVRNLLLDTPGGGHVALGRVADVAIVPAPTVIRHQDLSRTVDVMADVSGRDAGAVAADVRAAVDRMTFPLEYHAELVGDFAERTTAAHREIAVAVAAAIVIFLLLQAALAGWRLAAAAFVVLPLAVAGSLIAVVVTDRVFSIGTLAGCLAAAAMSVRFGVTLMRHYQALQRAKGGGPDSDLVRGGSLDRFAPIVTTTVVAGLGLVPFAVSGNVAGQEVLAPMATAIIGGLVAAALVNLFVVPVVYLRFGRAVAPPETSDVVVVPDVEQVA
jgi:Cu/Ag efflux pump CusA